MLRVILLLPLLLFAARSLADVQINVVGLFNDKAVLVIDGGKPQTLSVGKVSPEGVRLVSADSRRAVIEVNGKQRELGMGQAVSVSGNSAPAQTSVTLYANPQGHFLTEGSINGRPVKMLVDTGASAVAISGDQAKRLGIDYQKGETGIVSTAAGPVKSYAVTLASLKIGSVTLNQVAALVIDGASPPVVLLGMSALNRMQMTHEGMALTLTKKY